MSREVLQAIIDRQYEKAIMLAASSKIDFSVTDKNNDGILYHAAQAGYHKLISLFYKINAGTGQPFTQVDEAFFVAVKNDDHLTAKALVDNGVSPAIQDKDGFTALHHAAHHKHLQRVIFLLQYPNLVNVAAGGVNRTPLHFSARSDSSVSLAITDLLINAGAKVNVEDSDKDTPLHHAAKHGALLQARRLLQAGASYNKKNNTNRPPAGLVSGNPRLFALLSQAYDDAVASDSDSEDEANYEYKPNVKVSTHISLEPKTYTGTLPSGERKTFREESVLGDGNCGFIALGTNRPELTALLLARAGDAAIRDMVWKEIAELVMCGEFQPAGCQAVLTAHFAGQPDQLKAFCSSEAIFMHYINYLADPSKNIWLGHGTAMAYAKAKGVSVNIWQKNALNQLEIVQSYQGASPAVFNLFHTSGFTHFNLLVETDVADELTNQLPKLKVSDEPRTPRKKKVSEVNSEEVRVAHYRGTHFYREHYSRKQRQSAKRFYSLQNHGVINKTSLFSAACHVNTGMPHYFPDVGRIYFASKINEQLSLEQKKLKEASQKMAKELQALQKTGQVAPCLGDGRQSRSSYPTRYHEFIQRYVNSYRILKDDLSAAPSKTFDGRSSARIREKFTILKKLGVTEVPFVSTSEDAYWGAEYATAFVNWDKEGTHQPRNEHVQTLTPEYQADGHPRFPYMGFSHIILHSPKELADGSKSTRILDYFGNNLVDIKNASPGGAGSSSYARARERVFLAEVEAKNIAMVTMFRVPSFYGEYKPYYQEKYGLNKAQFDVFKAEFARHGAMVGGVMRNINAFNRTQQNVIEHMIEYSKSRLTNIAIELAQNENASLMYLDEKGQLVEALPDMSKFIQQNKANSSNKK